MFQMGGVGPMLGQAHHFLDFNPGKSDYAEKRYGDEARRLYGVMDRRLAKSRFLATPDFTITDVATWHWTVTHEWQGVDLDEFPNVKRLFEEVRPRPGVQRGWDVLRTGAKVPGLG